MMVERDERTRAGGAVSRRTILKGAAGLAGGAAAAFIVGGARGDAKLPKEQVSYQNSPKGDKRCADCVNFEGDASCRVVEGPISPDGWCRLWNKR
jgi:hypothetical protein